MHGLWRLGTNDLTLEQVNHHERPGVLPIAFTLMHAVRSEDGTTSRFLLHEPTLWEAGNWAARVGVSVPDVGRGTPVEVAETLRFADLDAWRDYQAGVFARTEQAIAELAPERLSELPLGGELPESARGSFLSMVVEPGKPPRLIDILECFVYQHGIRHIGELEHARALVDLGGVT